MWVAALLTMWPQTLLVPCWHCPVMRGLCACGASSHADLRSLCDIHVRCSAVNHVAFDTAGATLASASDDETVRVWDIITAQTVAVLEGHMGGVTCAVWAPSGDVIASCSRCETLYIVRFEA